MHTELHSSFRFFLSLFLLHQCNPCFLCSYVCCDTQSEMREWYANFLSVQVWFVFSFYFQLCHFPLSLFLVLFFCFFLLTVCPLSPTKYNGDVWPQDGLQQTRVSHVLPNTHHGNVSLIPLRGSENEMRNSVAAFSQDPLSVSEPTNQWN